MPLTTMRRFELGLGDVNVPAVVRPDCVKRCTIDDKYSNLQVSNFLLYQQFAMKNVLWDRNNLINFVKNYKLPIKYEEYRCRR